MAKLLRVRDKLLLGLALVYDLFDEVRSVGGTVSVAYKNMYGFAPRQYKKSNFYATVYRMVKTDLVEKVIEDGEPKLRLTAGGKNKAVRDFPLLALQNRRWDGKLRIIIFDIPESEKYKREIFRAKIKELGFGMIQKSVWVSPHPLEGDMREFIEAKELSDYVMLFVSDTSFVKDISSFVENIWRLNELNNSYIELIDTFKKSAMRLKDKAKFMKGFVSLILNDPFLPKGLLPRDWGGEKAWNIAKQIGKYG